MSRPDIRIVSASWPQDQAAIFLIRETVFVHEQSVSPELEWDGLDADSHHVLAIDANNIAVGTGRLLANGHIGRMAVLVDYRQLGIGSRLLLTLIDHAKKQSLTEVWLNAQVHASGFYLQHGFMTEGEEFLDAGIPHLKMRKII